MGVRRVVKSVVPDLLIETARRFQMLWRLRREYGRDRALYAKYVAQGDRHASPVGARSRNLEAQLTKDYHRVEKGLALRTPKRPFGVDVMRRFNAFLPAAAREGFSASPFFAYAEQARDVLHEWNECGIRNDELSPMSTVLPSAMISKEEFSSFIESRRSVRDFDSSRPVPTRLVREAVSIARNSPSVCNRQPWQVHLFEGADLVSKLLTFQNGNRGFRESLRSVAVITVDARLFAGFEERNQPWIEGGLFAAHLSLALHAEGVSTCLLNMSASHKTFRELRQFAEIDANEVVIMMMAIGYAAEGYRIARSPRRDVNQVLRIHRDR